jgi:hypothetical protein
MAQWHKLPILSSAIAGDEEVEGQMYHYVVNLGQVKVKEYYLSALPSYRWEVEFVMPNDHGGFIISRKGCFDFIYIYEEDSLTHILIMLSASSPSR